jgi:hypothetical protein
VADWKSTRILRRFAFDPANDYFPGLRAARIAIEVEQLQIVSVSAFLFG